MVILDRFFALAPGRPGFTGRQAALPLLFDIFDRLPASAPGSKADAPSTGDPPPALQQMPGEDDPPPRLLFPPDGGVLQLDAFGAAGPGLALSARGRGLRWYVDGAPAPANGQTGQTLWRPRGPGFYRIEAVDDVGRRAQARVRVTR